MIFNRFFKPNYQSSDPKKRIQSIQALDPSSTHDKQTLHELAFNDVDASVSLVALERLNSFVLWLKMSQIAVDRRVRRTAENRVLELLSESSSSVLSDVDRRLFIAESTNPVVIKLGLNKTQLFRWDANEAASLVQKLDDPAFQRQFMLQTESPELQLLLLQQIDELPLLQKLLKKPLHEEPMRWLEGKIEELTVLSERPIKLQRQIILLLSKLKALAECGDYAKIVEQKLELSSQIIPLNDELATFDTEVTRVNTTKLEALTTRLAIIIEQLQPEFEAQQFKQRQQQLETKWLNAADAAITQTRAMAEHAIAENELPDLEEYRSKISGLIEQHEQQILGQQPSIKLILSSLYNTLSMLEQLTEIVLVVAQISSAVEQFKHTFVLPNSYKDLDQARQTFNATEKQINDLLAGIKVELSDGVLKPWNDIRTEWLQKLTKLKKQAAEQLSAVDKKVSTVNSMIKQGRFKPAIAVFAKLKRSYEDLPISFQTRIERSYLTCLERIAELEDWQQYIAQPRKPELLDEVTVLADQIDDIDISARRADVERLRKTWMSFGRLNTEEDNQLNALFDETLERAFSPCREFFAKQQLERHSNAESASQLLKEFEACDSEDDTVFVKSYVALAKKWNNLGSIESVKWQKLKQQFADLNKPLKQRQITIQKANASAKQGLVNIAMEIAESIAPDSADRVKKLQAEWKTIGFAGRTKDNRLWATFKLTNDQIFEKIRSDRTETKQLAKQAFEGLQVKFEMLSNEVDKIYKIEQGKVLKTNAEALSQELNDMHQQGQLNKEMFEKLTRQHQKINVTIAKEIKKLNELQINQKVDDAFDYLYSRVGEPTLLGEDAPKLLHSVTAQKRNETSSRLSLTIRLELLAGAESLDSDAELRKQIQLKMMAKKMQSGDLDSVQDLFSEWLLFGPIQEEEKGLLDRFANAYRLAETVSDVEG